MLHYTRADAPSSMALQIEAILQILFGLGYLWHAMEGGGNWCCSVGCNNTTIKYGSVTSLGCPTEKSL